MDKIQIYEVILLLFTFVIVAIHVEEAPDVKVVKAEIQDYLFGMALHLPIVGRIFGWW